MSRPFLDYDDHDSYRTAFDDWLCPCGERGAYATTPGQPPHYATVNCRACDRWLGWLPWPTRSRAEEKANRPRLRRVKLDDDYCDLCLRTRDRLPDGVTLEVRHAMDRAVLVDAGRPPDEPDNLGWICSSPCKGIELALRAGFDH